MANLKISEVLLAYDVPLVVTATDGRQRNYIGVNYADGSEACLFYFARVKDDDLEKLLREKVDVRYLLTKKRIGKFEFGELWGEAGETVSTESRDTVEEKILPKPGMFIPFSQRKESASSQLKAVHIDGRWGIEDLRKFSDLVQDCYAIVYALAGKGTKSAQQKIEHTFQRYPWRGGFSSVKFFDDLYSLIPIVDRADIGRIQYASPGTIEFKMNDSVANSIRKMVGDINSKDSQATKTYSEIHSWLRDKGWLGKSQVDLRLSTHDRDELIENFEILCSAFGLSNRANDILSFASADPLGAVKIILAYYRRLKGLADYVATGKAQDLFTKAPAHH